MMGDTDAEMNRTQFQAIAVLSVECDQVRFTVLSVEDGHVVSSSTRALPLIRAEDCHAWNRIGSAVSEAAADAAEARREKSRSPRPPPMEAGHVEQDPEAIWCAVETVIGAGLDGLCRSGTPVTYIKSLAIVNEMSTLVAWNVTTGAPLHHAVHWTDSRMDGCGRTAGAAEWLLQRSAVVACAGSDCRMGTLDAWLVWKFTAGQTYVTDVTNASCTGLLDLDTLDWDGDAVRECGLTVDAWPAVRGPADNGADPRAAVVLVGRLYGLTMAATMTRPGATLYGQSCARRGHVAVTLADGVATVLGASDGPPPGGNKPPRPDGPRPVVGYCETGPVDAARPRVVYALLAVSTAPEVIGWLRDNVALVRSMDECMNVYSSARPAGGGYQLPSVVPAVNGLPNAPYGRADACLLMCGVSEQMDRTHLVVAAMDSLCYTVADMVRSVVRGHGADAVHVDGRFCRYDHLLARLADTCDCPVIRRRADMATSGAARMAAVAVNTGFDDRYEQTDFGPTCTPNEREFCLQQWAKALPRSYGWFGTADHDLGPPPPRNQSFPVRLLRRVGQALSTCYNEAVLFCKTF